ncbi:glycosyltransferase family 4 protein [Alienimonas californiensis]|uniref:Glycosyltransferase EpsF n=1 Tax=Alienimonas californiensis TaxID=2527989 RepID=A0A517P807_9PLAN|nr:glycosyltransferase family 4 protein [Alienimonas californiensis]QDT15485.1 Putative glycosyltransferase EpsF [Alienimonas californiensis]
MSDSLRILIDTEHAAIVGGAETYLRAVLPQLVAAGHELAVVTARPADGPSSIVAQIPGLRCWTREGNSPDTLLAEIADWRPDVVYSHGAGDPAWEAALAGRFPTVLYAHNYHGACVSGTKRFARPRVQTCCRTLGPGCLALYLPRGCGGRSPATMLRSYAVQRRRQANLTRFRAVLVASAAMQEEYARHGVPADRLRLVPLFPPDAVPDPAPPAPRDRSDRVLFVGRVTELKGLSHLIPALATASAELGRRLSLTVAGDGPALAEAEDLARQTGVPAEFPGWVDADRRQAAMRSADLLAVPSLWPEPFGLVGVEAGCVGLPAVGYATGGIPDWLIPGVSGESAPGDRPNPAALAAALVRALADDAHFNRLRVGAWETARRFGADAHVRQLVAVLRDAAAPSTRPNNALKLEWNGFGGRCR